MINVRPRNLHIQICKYAVIGLEKNKIGAKSRDLLVSMQEGRRCCCDEFFATVRFVGEVPPSKGKTRTVS